MVPFEVEEGQPPPPVPPRRTDPLSLRLRFRRCRNVIWTPIRNFQLNYPGRLKLYAICALFSDLVVTNVGLNLLQRIHLNEKDLENKWQHLTPVIISSILYLFPAFGILNKTNILLLVYVLLTSFYLAFSFVFTLRSSYKLHYAHYFFRSHYCPTRFASSDSLLCVLSLIKFTLIWPVFRIYVHSRDCIEYKYYARREIRNNYGMVEFQQQPETVQSTLSEQNNQAEEVDEEEQKKREEVKKIFAGMVTTNRVYENTEIRSPPSSSFSSTLDDLPIDYRAHFNDSDGMLSSDDEEVLGDIEEEDEDFGIIQNQCQ